MHKWKIRLIVLSHYVIFYINRHAWRRNANNVKEHEEDERIHKNSLGDEGENDEIISSISVLTQQGTTHASPSKAVDSKG